VIAESLRATTFAELDAFGLRIGVEDMYCRDRVCWIGLAVIALVGLMVSPGLCQPTASDAKQDSAKSLTLIIGGEIDADMAPVAGRLATFFYQCYPKLLERFEHPRKPAPRQIHLVFQRGLKYAGQTSGATITVSVEWLKIQPDDLGMLTHELTHVVQAYPSPEPGWLTEGVAEYARHLYGPKEQPGSTLGIRESLKRCIAGCKTGSLPWMTSRR
jgi:hypothetical protein